MKLEVERRFVWEPEVVTSYRWHYVYRLEDAKGHFYYGARTSQIEPERDSYLGSGHWCLWQKKNEPVTKAVLKAFPSRGEADREEALLIEEHISNPLCMNLRRYRTRRQF